MSDKIREEFEAWFESLNHSKPEKGFGPGGHYYLHQRVEDAWCAWQAAISQQPAPTAVPDGWKMVPVERIQIALEAVQNAMLDAYSNAYQECCGRGQGQCCGDPDAAWSAEDQRIMDALSPAQRELSGLLAAAPAAPVAQEPVAWRVSDPAEPEIGHWLSEEPGASWQKSEPLYTAPPAAEQLDTVPVPRELPAHCTIGDFLLSIGWSAASDAQWERLKNALPELRALLGKETA